MPSETGLRVCNTLWIGEALGPVERACLRSMLRMGHRVRLHCYEEPRGVPNGVELADAAEVLPRSLVVRHRSGSASLFSNRFRYELMRRGAGLWVDTDIYLVRPIDCPGPYVVGRQDERMANGAVLLLPPASPILPELLALFESNEIPWWLSRRARLIAWLRRRSGRGASISDMPWGTAGPNALTALIHRAGLRHLLLPEETFYPVPWQKAQWVSDPNIALDHVARPSTIAVHLWNTRIAPLKDMPAPAGSFLARLQDEGASGSC